MPIVSIRASTIASSSKASNCVPAKPLHNPVQNFLEFLKGTFSIEVFLQFSHLEIISIVAQVVIEHLDKYL